MDIQKETIDLDAIIKKSFRITIMCHSSADPDAMGSLLAMREILFEHYHKNFVNTVAENVSSSLHFLPGFEQVNTQSIVKSLIDSPPDLVILLDFNMWHMTSPVASAQIRAIIEKEKIPIVVIDHHPPEIMNIESKLYINREDNSTSQTLYRIFIDELKVELTPSIAANMLAGILGDTGGFKYDHPALSYSFQIGAELLKKSPLSIEYLSKTMNTIPDSSLSALQTIVKNAKSLENGIYYSQLIDTDIINNNLYRPDISSAAKFFLSNIMLNFENLRFGFIVYPRPGEEHKYTVMFRSADETQSVKRIAEDLGGGGHDKASASKIDAESSEDALVQIMNAIRGNSILLKKPESPQE